MNDPEFLKALLETFKIEAEEHIAAIGSGLVALENASTLNRRMEVIEKIFREAHSLKGAARAVNLGKLEGLCQSLESAFAGIKNQDTALSPELFDRLHHMVAAAGLEAGVVPGTDSPEPKEPSSRPVETLPPATPSENPSPQFRLEEKQGFADTVRISTAKLAAILQQAEELISSKAIAAHRLVELREVKNSLAHWETEWRKIRPQVHVLQRSGEGHSPINGSGNGTRNSVPNAPVLVFLERNERILQSISSQITSLAAGLDSDRRVLERRVGELLDDIKRMSMLPFSKLLGIFPKVVRDLCRDCGKDAELVIQGGEIEAGRPVLDEIKDPLMHLLRNCIDHGVEPVAERVRQGKPARATITISITPKGGSRVDLVIADDGAGIDVRKVVAAAAKQGLISREDAQGIDERRALALMFQSGLSTSPMLTAVSGRGLGLAIVREKVEGLGGEISVETQPGLGTSFRLTLPLTVATFRGILVRSGRDLFVIPTMYVRRAIRVARDAVKSVENRATMEFEGRAVSLVWLAEVLGGSRAPDASEVGHKWPGVLLEWADERIVFLVDEILHDQEVIVKGLGKQLRRVRNISGAAVLETGKVVPVLNVADLMRSAASVIPVISDPEAESKTKSVLVAEDSITSRTLLRGILESSGYTVTTAVDGAEAFSMLENGTFDLVVSDVEMPKMTGFDLTAKIRGVRRLADLPVVLVTALDSREDRERGADVGANAYIVKSSFDQSNLLEVVQRLI